MTASPDAARPSITFRASDDIDCTSETPPPPSPSIGTPDERRWWSHCTRQDEDDEAKLTEIDKTVTHLILSFLPASFILLFRVCSDSVVPQRVKVFRCRLRGCKLDRALLQQFDRTSDVALLSSMQPSLASLIPQVRSRTKPPKRPQLVLQR